MKFRKKPVVIEAVQWIGDNLKEIIEFTDGSIEANLKVLEIGWPAYKQLVALKGFKVYTLEGIMAADVGDWIIKGVKNEFYPRKPDIFEATYEPVEDNSEIPLDKPTNDG